MKILPLNSKRPAMNQSLLSPEQLEQRLKDVGGAALKSAGLGVVSGGGKSVISDKLAGEQMSPVKALKEAGVGGFVSGALKVGYEAGKDALHTFVTHDTSENVGKYAPDHTHPLVQEELRTIARRERDQAYTTPSGHITTPSLAHLNIVSDDQRDFDED